MKVIECRIGKNMLGSALHMGLGGNAPSTVHIHGGPVWVWKRNTRDTDLRQQPPLLPCGKPRARLIEGKAAPGS